MTAGSFSWRLLVLTTCIAWPACNFCPQINCTRDKFGNVTEGAPDEVQRVFYFWALQQEGAGFVGTDGKVYPPRWQLREMLVQGMMQLVS